VNCRWYIKLREPVFSHEPIQRFSYVSACFLAVMNLVCLIEHLNFPFLNNIQIKNRSYQNDPLFIM
jgi:hypothetical protein